MKMNVLIASLVTGIAAGSAGAANLLLNPGFELNANNQEPTFWENTANKVKDEDLGITPFEGEKQFQFQDDDRFLSQDVTLTAAGQYDLSMWIATRNSINGSGISNGFNTLASGQVKFELLDSTDTVVAPTTAVSADYDVNKGIYVQWTRSYSSLAAGDYTVRVSSGTGLGGANQGMVDDFSLTLVPEPGSLALLAAGGLLIARRRRG